MRGKQRKKVGRFYNVSLKRAVYYYFIRMTKLRSKSDRAEARKFYNLCLGHKKGGAEQNRSAMLLWDGVASPPITYYPKPRWLKIWFY